MSFSQRIIVQGNAWWIRILKFPNLTSIPLMLITKAEKLPSLILKSESTCPYFNIQYTNIIFKHDWKS